MRILIDYSNFDTIISHYVHEVDGDLVRTHCNQLIKINVDFNQLITIDTRNKNKNKDNDVTVNCEKCKSEFKKL